jgi:hypothetical protein
MSTEQQPQPPATEPKSEPTVLALGLATGWDKFKQGQLVSYPVMALVLVLVTALGVGWWIMSERRKAESVKWSELDALSAGGPPTVAALEEYVKKYPNTPQAKVATLEIARLHLGLEGIEKMSIRETDLPMEGGSESARKIRAAAVSNVEKAREEFAKLADDFKTDLAIRVECLFAGAKAEAVLVGVPKEGQVEQFRGDPAKAVELLDKVAEAAPETPWGKDAKKLADALRNQNTKDQVITLQSMMFRLTPSLPGGTFPKMPNDPAHGFGP